jgi:8-oxo-dGTP pyrophosphatase MutT (NUDIX family)
MLVASKRHFDKPMKNKVLAYITRHQNGREQLLVFEHRDFPEAGVQVPAGTVEPDEPVESALLREVHEESGLAASDVRLVRKLAESEEVEWGHLRHIFHLALVNGKPDSWAHIVQGEGEDAGLVFDYYWVDLAADAPRLGGQGKWLYLIGAT